MSENQPNYNEQRAQLQIERYFSAAHAERIQFMQFVKEYGQDTIKTLVLLHGGSMVALLTFLGALFSKTEGAQFRLAASMLSNVTPALAYFAAGILCAVISSGIAYLNFSAATEASYEATDLLKWAKGELPDEKLPWLHSFSRWTALAAVALVILSVISFLMGAWYVASAFGSLGQSAWVEGARDLMKPIPGQPCRP